MSDVVEILSELLRTARRVETALGAIHQRLGLVVLASGARFVDFGQVVVLPAPAQNRPGTQIVKPDQKQWTVAAVFAKGYNNGAVRIGRNPEGARTDAAAQAIIADNDSATFFLAPGETIYAQGVETGGESSVTVSVTPVQKVSNVGA